MKTLNEKLSALKTKLDKGEQVTVAIFGLGSVGCYLLDYLVSLADPQLKIAVIGRDVQKMTKDVNIIRTAACIRRQLKSEIEIVGDCDFSDVASLTAAFHKVKPDFIVNSSRLYAGLKYGTISWSNLRAYGIWAPLSVQLAKNIMLAYEAAGSNAISINTSYSDAVIPWLKSAGMAFFDFGSGNLNHLIPRIKFAVASKLGIEDLNALDITLVASHFHDVVISKEGHTEGVELLLSVKFRGEILNVNPEDLFKACSIPMPTDQKRNMMNASSNFDIIRAILTAIRERRIEKIHTPGVLGNIGGYPFLIDGSGIQPEGRFCPEFPLAQMISVNRKSIYKDGIENVVDGSLVYTEELIAKVQDRFAVQLPKTVSLDDATAVADLLIERIIKPNIQ